MSQSVQSGALRLRNDVLHEFDDSFNLLDSAVAIVEDLSLQRSQIRFQSLDQLLVEE